MGLTPEWTPLRYHPDQSKAWRSTAQFVNLVAGRGSGKSAIAKRRCVRYLPVKKPHTDPKYFYALPTYGQAKRVAWKELKALVPPEWLDGRPSESELIIKTVFGSELHLVGMDKPERIEGVQWDGCVLDESCDLRPGVFTRSVLPALSHRNGWCWRIGVAKRFGVGAREFKKFFDRGLQGAEPNIESYTWKSADIIPPDALAFAREYLSAIDFREQYEASWETAGGLVFHAFLPSLHVRPVSHIPDRKIIVGSDFNVDPMSWTLCQQVAGRLRVFDEIFIRNTNTQNTLNELWNRYGKVHTGGWEFRGDASGRARKTSATHSDYQIIKADTRFHDAAHGPRVFYARSNPAILDRFAACNAVLQNANQKSRIDIDPKCEHLIEDLGARAYKQGTRLPDDSGDVSHMSDALGYVIYPLYPMTTQVPVEDAPVHVG